jgi:hypothetical protein
LRRNDGFAEEANDELVRRGNPFLGKLVLLTAFSLGRLLSGTTFLSCEATFGEKRLYCRRKMTTL